MAQDDRWTIFPDCPVSDEYVILAHDWCSQYSEAVHNPDAYKEEIGQEFDSNCVVVGHVATITEWAMNMSGLIPGSPLTKEALTQKMERVLMFGQNVWMYTIYCLANEYNIHHLNENGYLLGVIALADDITQTQLGECLREAAINLITSMAGAMIEHLSKPENNPTYIQGPDEETIRKIMENLSSTDESTIVDFLNTFKEIGTFRMDPSEYKTDKDRELHTKMIALYRKIMGE